MHGTGDRDVADETPDADVEESGEGDGTWWLVAHVPTADPDVKAGLEILREVGTKEYEAVAAANALINRLARAAPYARIVEVYQDVEAALERLTHTNPPSMKRVAAEVNRAARVLGVAAAALPADVQLHADEDLEIGTEDADAIVAAIVEETRRPSFRLLVAIGELEQGPFAAAADEIVNDPEAVATLAAKLGPLPPQFDILGSLRIGVIVCQRLIGRQLLVYKDRVDDATRVIKRLAAEVLDGEPSLMRSKIDIDIENKRMEMGPASFDHLALREAALLQRARRHAEEMLNATAAAGDAATAARADSGDADERAAAHQTRTPGADVSAEATVSTEDAASDDAESDPGDQPEKPGGEGPELPPGDRAAQTLDLRALVQHATDLADSLERVWSDALEPDALAAAHDEFSDKITSLLLSLQRCVAAGDRALRAAGVDPQVPVYPLSLAGHERVTFTPDAERRWRQLQLAELDALIALLGDLETMRAPSAHRVTLATGEVESWWQAGGFEILRRRAQLLARISEAAEAAEAHMTGAPVEDLRHQTVFDRLRLAGAAYHYGDLEAALWHGTLALKARAALETDDVPTDILERIAGNPRLGEEAVLVRRLSEAAQRIAQGEALDLGAAMVVVAPVLRLVSELCLERGEIIVDALGGGRTANGQG